MADHLNRAGVHVSRGRKERWSMLAPSPASSHLLLVEHDPGVGDLLHAFLAKEGYDVLVVASPQEALACLDEHTYSLILTDLFKPAQTDPFRSVELLRDRAHPTPVVVMTGWNVGEEEVTGRGFASLVRKPFDLEDILTSIAASLKRPLSPAQGRQAA